MKTITTRVLSVVMLILLVATAAFVSVSCSDKQSVKEISFTVTVVNGGDTKQLNVTTTEKTVGDALYAEGIIDGKGDGYITTVDGHTCNWDTDQTYWAFYINDEYANTGVYDTAIDPKATYKLEVTKG